MDWSVGSLSHPFHWTDRTYMVEYPLHSQHLSYPNPSLPCCSQPGYPPQVSDFYLPQKYLCPQFPGPLTGSLFHISTSSSALSRYHRHSLSALSVWNPPYQPWTHHLPLFYVDHAHLPWVWSPWQCTWSTHTEMELVTLALQKVAVFYQICSFFSSRIWGIISLWRVSIHYPIQSSPLWFVPNVALQTAYLSQSFSSLTRSPTQVL